MPLLLKSLELDFGDYFDWTVSMNVESPLWLGLNWLAEIKYQPFVESRNRSPYLAVVGLERRRHCLKCRNWRELRLFGADHIPQFAFRSSNLNALGLRRNELFASSERHIH